MQVNLTNTINKTNAADPTTQVKTNYKKFNN